MAKGKLESKDLEYHLSKLNSIAVVKMSFEAKDFDRLKDLYEAKEAAKWAEENSKKAGKDKEEADEALKEAQAKLAAAPASAEVKAKVDAAEKIVEAAKKGEENAKVLVEAARKEVEDKKQLPRLKIAINTNEWSGVKDENGNVLLTCTDKDQSSYTIKKVPDGKLEVTASPKFTGQLCFGTGQDTSILKYKEGKLVDAVGSLEQFTDNQKKECEKLHVAEAFIQMDEKFLKELTEKLPKGRLDTLNDKLQRALRSKDSFDAREINSCMRELEKAGVLKRVPMGEVLNDKKEKVGCTLSRNKDRSIKVELTPPPEFSGRIFITGKGGGVSVLEYKDGKCVDFIERGGGGGLDPKQREEYNQKKRGAALEKKAELTAKEMGKKAEEAKAAGDPAALPLPQSPVTPSPQFPQIIGTPAVPATVVPPSLVWPPPALFSPASKESLSSSKSPSATPGGSSVKSRGVTKPGSVG